MGSGKELEDLKMGIILSDKTFVHLGLLSSNKLPESTNVQQDIAVHSGFLWLNSKQGDRKCKWDVDSE